VVRSNTGTDAPSLLLGPEEGRSGLLTGKIGLEGQREKVVGGSCREDDGELGSSNLACRSWVQNYEGQMHGSGRYLSSDVAY
jgi:hypothetical protein